jgi:hypothetical protein
MCALGEVRGSNSRAGYFQATLSSPSSKATQSVRLELVHAVREVQTRREQFTHLDGNFMHNP